MSDPTELAAIARREALVTTGWFRNNVEVIATALERLAAAERALAVFRTWSSETRGADGQHLVTGEDLDAALAVYDEFGEDGESSEEQTALA